MKVVDGGEYLRKIAASKSKNSNYIAQKINKGNLAPTNVIRNWLHKQIFSKPIKKGLLISGQPRMIGEAKLALKWFKESGRGLPVVIFLKVSRQETIKRLRKRYICRKCGCDYIFSKAPARHCKKCRGKIVQRIEDKDLAAIKNRLAYFCRQVSKTLKFFKKKGVLIEINGEQSERKVFENIVKNIEL